MELETQSELEPPELKILISVSDTETYRQVTVEPLCTMCLKDGKDHIFNGMPCKERCVNYQQYNFW